VRPEAPVLGDIVDAPGEMAGMLRETLTAGEVGRLSELVDKLLVEQEPPDVTRWLRAVEHSECRAGLLLSGDLAATARALRRCPPAAPGLSLKEVTRQLVAFSVSEAYFRLRRAVGFYIEPRGGG